MWGASLPIACIAALSLAVDLPSRLQKRWLQHVLHILVFLPFVVMAFLFLADAYTYRLVWEHGGADLPLRYRLAALWEGREGPILMWAACMSLIGMFTLNGTGGESESSRRLRMACFHGFTTFMLFLAWGMGAFDAAQDPKAPRSQLNELLQTDLMVIHPPIIFLYYSLCIALSSVVLAALFDPESEIDTLPERLIPLARPTMFVGTLGIGLGGLWAYTVLDWGGYWAWDPVETASLLPWLAVVVLLHLPQRPQRTDAKWWALAGLMPGALAILSTLVTRANGVWVSRHAFVGDGSGSVPEDVWGRMMLIRGDIGVGVEVVGYLLLVILPLSTWVAWTMRQQLRSAEDTHALPSNWSIPWMVVPFSAILMLLMQPLGEEQVAEILWGSVSGLFVSIVAFSPLFSLLMYRHELLERLKEVPNLLVLFGTISAAFLCGDVILASLSILIILPIIVQKDGYKTGSLLAIPILFWIFTAWAQVVEISAAAVGMGAVLLPWLIFSEEVDEPRGSPNPQRLALMAPSTLGSTFILLTWMLLFASIDSPRFEAQELLGSVLISLVVLALTIFGWRKKVEKQQQLLLAAGVLLLALLLAAMAHNSLPGDPNEALSGAFVRGHVAWLLILPLMVAIPAMLVEVSTAIASLRKRLQRRGSKGSSNRWRTLGAHVVHLGILLLLLGHVFTTTLIDRGDADHRHSLEKDEAKVVGDYAYIFREVVIISDDDQEFSERFVVGDGYIGARVDVHTLDDGEVGELLATLEPGVLRFDSPNGRVSARSEIDSKARLHGDLMMIFDSSQAGGLMTSSLMGGLDDVDSIRVTIHDLKGSHLVWLGWTLILAGLILGSATWQSGVSSKTEEE
ncbi:MAG: hypothetical protein CMB49_01390 [Euryarchaeota archaeon]|nr:hypothetical protein [Euryarchaeota archaeon]